MPMKKLSKPTKSTAEIQRFETYFQIWLMFCRRREIKKRFWKVRGLDITKFCSKKKNLSPPNKQVTAVDPSYRPVRPVIYGKRLFRGVLKKKI